MSDALPEFADEWGSANLKCCGKRVVLCAGWGHTHIVCQVSGWGIDKCSGASDG